MGCAGVVDGGICGWGWGFSFLDRECRERAGYCIFEQSMIFFK